jgi:hypothetical protein
MNTRVFVASLLALAIAAPAANALTIVNADKGDVTVKVKPKGTKTESLDIKAGGQSDVDCTKGCELTLGKVKQAVDGKVVTITIKGGKFVL